MQQRIFDVMQKQAKAFFQQFSLDYSFEKNQIEKNIKIVGSNYISYRQYWYSDKLNQEFKISITFYLDSDSKSLINIRLYRYSEANKTEFEKTMNVEEYFHKHNNTPFIRLEEYNGDNIEENIKSFFIWFRENMNEKLLDIFRGKSWIEIPPDWGWYK